MGTSLLEQFGITDAIGIYNTILNTKQLKNNIDNKQLAELLLNCTQIILEKIKEQNEKEIHLEKGELYMILISDMVDEMKEELDGACDYYKMATKIKMMYPDMARKYIEMAKAELNHAMALHQMSADLINKEKEKMTTEVADYMKEYYEEAHEYYTDKYNYLVYLIDKFSM